MRTYVSLITVMLCVAGCGATAGRSGGSRSTTPGDAPAPQPPPEPPPPEPPADATAREICQEEAGRTIVGDDFDFLALDVLIETLVAGVQSDADAGFTRLEETQAAIATCEETGDSGAQQWCTVCMLAILDEVYENFVPITGAREACQAVARGVFGDDPDMVATLDILVDSLLTAAENGADFGLTRQEMQQSQILASCEDPPAPWCSHCVRAIVNEVFDNYVPIPGARGTCARARFPDDTIDAMFALARMIMDGGVSAIEFVTAPEIVEGCRNYCAANAEPEGFFTERDCLASCRNCNIAIADEVYNSARGVCRRGGFLDDSIDSMFSLLELARDEEYSQVEILRELTNRCETTCETNGDITEYSTLQECIGGCMSCLLAIADEVW